MSLWILILIKTPTDKKVLNQLNLELCDLRCLNAIFIHSCFIDSTTRNSLNPASKDKNIIKFLYQEAISCVFSTYQSHKWDSHLISPEYNTSNLSLISLCNVSVNLLFNLGKNMGWLQLGWCYTEYM